MMEVVLDAPNDRRADLAYGYAFMATVYSPGLASAHDTLSRALRAYGQPDLAQLEDLEAKRLQSKRFSPYH